MSKFLFGLACLSALALGGAPPALALPMGGAGIPSRAQAEPLVRDVRVFCYNRSSGRFIHWGECAVAHAPRVYCRSNYTGQFLHWGSCY